jgi:hypothetical protein
MQSRSVPYCTAATLSQLATSSTSSLVFRTTPTLGPQDESHMSRDSCSDRCQQLYAEPASDFPQLFEVLAEVRFKLPTFFEKGSRTFEHRFGHGAPEFVLENAQWRKPGPSRMATVAPVMGSSTSRSASKTCTSPTTRQVSLLNDKSLGHYSSKSFRIFPVAPVTDPLYISASSVTSVLRRLKGHPL